MKDQLYKYFWRIVFTILLLITIGLLVWFIIDLRGLYQTGIRPAGGFNRDHIHRQILSPNQIQSWMTFSYVDYIFSLSPDYLQNSLTIIDSRYPNLNISQYAREKGLDAGDFLKQIQTSVAKYATSATSTTR